MSSPIAPKRWTRKRPDMVGYYWWIPQGEENLEPVIVYRDLNGTWWPFGAQRDIYPKPKGRFFGPLKPPTFN